MKFIKIFRILAIALLLILSVAVTPPTPALAAGDLYIYPSSGEIGDELRLDGAEFAALQDYDIYFSSERASVGEDIDTDVLNYEFMGEISTDSDGIFIDEYFDVPEILTDGDDEERVRGGTYYIYATFDGQEEIKARASFTVEFTTVITIDPEEGEVGTEVEVTGEGYSDREDITVEYDGTSLDIESGDEDTDSNGEFEDTKIIIPPSTAGVHTITVTGDDSDSEAEAEFTVEPKITIAPESGAVGSTIIVSGTGFGDEVDVNIIFNNTLVTQEETDDDGSFTASFAVPSSATGSYDITAEDDDNSDEASFTITATVINLTPTNGNVGDNIDLSGSGFMINTSISVTFDNDPVKTISTDSGGAFTTSFSVPIRVAGTYKVKVSDGTNLAEASFIISTTASINPVTSVASPGYVGSELAVSGVGFTPGRTAIITYDGNEVATTTVNTNGTFSANFNAPTSSGGEHKIITTDVINTIEFTFFMESTPPSTVYPQLPLMDTKLEDWRFDWCGDATDLSKEVTDASLPVTYTFQIATDETFAEDSIVLEKTGLTESEYTLTKEERLESAGEEAPYYWRVKAIDSASNEKQSGVGAFYVSGFSFSMSQPVIYTLIGVGALLLAIFAFWMGRKTAYY